MQSHIVVLRAALGPKNDLDIPGEANPFGGPLERTRFEPVSPEQLKRLAQQPSRVR